MKLFKVSELLGVDAATTSWNMKIGKKKAGEDFMPNPGEGGGGLGGGGVGEGGGLSSVFGADTLSIGAGPSPSAAPAPTPAPTPAPKASGGGGASESDAPAETKAEPGTENQAPAEGDKIMASDLDENTKKAIAALHTTLEAARYKTRMSPAQQTRASAAGRSAPTAGRG